MEAVVSFRMATEGCAGLITHKFDLPERSKDVSLLEAVAYQFVVSHLSSLNQRGGNSYYQDQVKTLD